MRPLTWKDKGGYLEAFDFIPNVVYSISEVEDGWEIGVWIDVCGSRYADTRNPVTPSAYPTEAKAKEACEKHRQLLS